MTAEQSEPPRAEGDAAVPGLLPSRELFPGPGQAFPGAVPAGPGEVTPKEATPKEALVTHSRDRATEVLLGDPAVLTGVTAPAPAGGFPLALVTPSTPAGGTGG